MKITSNLEARRGQEIADLLLGLVEGALTRWYKGDPYGYLELYDKDNYSYFDHRFLDGQINELKDNKKYYQDEIKKDQEQIKQLKNPEQIEKYVREKYFMKKDSEDIYIIQFEGDTIPEKE